ncbi:MAG TPA: GAP family protein [Solirubrobacteraceae bacterium]|nr:GAP family protein [Solirubrobacteraceae bacterium]
MPPEAVSLALAASIYPPALAAVIALGRGVEVRLRVVLFVLAAYCTVLVTGAIMLFLFDELDATRDQLITPTAGLYVAAGSALLFVATRLRRPRPRASPEHADRSRTDRYLQSRWLVVVLGVILYVVPSPIFAGAVKAIADTHVSAAQKVAYLAQMLLIMLWLIELPMLMLIAFPRHSADALERVNAWFAMHGRRLLVLASGVLGGYLLVVGVVELAG